MAFLVPPINTKGFYQLKSPWSVANNVIYECIAIREFHDFTQIGADVFEMVYQPKGLDRSIYESDLAAGAKIITLQSATRPTIYVPNSYLLAYPSNDNVAYSHTVLSISLGPVADAMNLEFLQDQLSGVCSDVIGVTPTVRVHAAPSDEYISAAQHAALEQARQDAIAQRTTDRARLIAADQTISELRQVLAQYEAILRHHDLIPE